MEIADDLYRDYKISEYSGVCDKNEKSNMFIIISDNRWIKHSNELVEFSKPPILLNHFY